MKVAKNDSSSIYKNLDSIKSKRLNQQTIDLAPTTLFSSIDLKFTDESQKPNEHEITLKLNKEAKRKVLKSIPHFSEPRFSESNRSSYNEKLNISDRSLSNKNSDYILINPIESNSSTNNTNRKLKYVIMSFT